MKSAKTAFSSIMRFSHFSVLINLNYLALLNEKKKVWYFKNKSFAINY
ncbi:hypothetical protein AM1_3386 [Acaryochloris marina MBIC11017]|uniref:Uncharacterized protein n=1 Tax=Acaryochloris marina (strain MBIC 11017) TaxID=329726 RepID=B0C033_ACAM1|nr:hypothetical protein AM1_3386 [Acaryochloris marina MBIC11017]